MRDIIPLGVARLGVHHANNGLGWDPAARHNSICGGQPQVAVQQVVDFAKVEDKKYFGLEFIDLGVLVRKMVHDARMEGGKETFRSLRSHELVVASGLQAEFLRIDSAACLEVPW